MKILIVGAGFTGATLGERLTSIGHKVTVIDKRDHIGGNAYDYVNEHGVRVHKYGPHIFHTDSKKIWDYLSRFTEWTPYNHKVVARVDGDIIPLPVNFNTIRRMFPNADEIIKHLCERYTDKVSVMKLMTDPLLEEFAKIIYKKIFYSYTVKQWGMTPDQLDPSVLARVPVRLSDNDDYFLDEYQGMPKDGYTAMFKKMLHGIDVRLDTPFEKEFTRIYDKVIFTGCIDEFFNYELGKLPYRSLIFEFDSAVGLSNIGTINYPNEYEFTRVTNMRVLTGGKTRYSTLCYEYPEPYESGRNEPYYPVPSPENKELYRRYEKLSEELKGKIYFAGRLGAYAYLDMHQAVGAALALFEKEFPMEKAA